MKLTLSAGALSLGALTVRGADGQERYRFEPASRFTWKMTDADGQKRLSLYREWDKGGLKPLRPCHGTLGDVKFTAVWEAPFPPMIDFGSFGWKAEGDLLSRSFTLTKQGKTAAVLKRHWLRPGSSYTLDVTGTENALEALAVALCIHLMRKRR